MPRAEPQEPLQAIKTILLVDDEPQVLSLLVVAFEITGHRLLKARDGGECLRIARKRLPDLVLLDILMPVMDGIQVCRALKGDPATAVCKVVLLTALAQEDTYRRGLEAGADAIVTKPFSPTALVAKINAMLREG